MPDKGPRPLSLYLSLRQRAETYIAVVAVIGLVCGIAWNRSVELPTYYVGDDFSATIEESQIAQLMAVDVMYCLIGVIAGFCLGALAWALFRTRGWLGTAMAAIGAAVAGVLTRVVAQFIGPKDFDTRIVAAEPGAFVRADFAGHTWVPLCLWVGAAMVPILIGSALGRRWGTPGQDSGSPAKIDKTDKVMEPDTTVAPGL
ncbi:MAG: hypothetical protein LBN10_08955 [Propionibacteriaceae bacterium]|jgi:hypothetical protein|nr:hypothetical protein [Propionibacteriaceae bacterium]